MDTHRAPDSRERPGRIARSTAFFSIATAASRLAGLAREIVAAGYFGVKGPMSAFTVAFQVPNLVRMLFADAALQPAFVPIFTEQLEKGNHREAFRLATTLLFTVGLALGAITAVFVLCAGLIMPLFAPGFGPELEDLTIALSQLLFPILILLGLTGIVVGILNSYDRFGAFAISPLFWNLTIIGPCWSRWRRRSPRGDRIYAYAIGILAGTVVQLADPGLGPQAHAVPHDPQSRLAGALAQPARAPGAAADAAGDDQPRADQLQPPGQQHLRQPRLRPRRRRRSTRPSASTSCRRGSSRSRSQRFSSRPWPGMPPVEPSTDLRATMANGMRQIIFVLVPAAAAILVLSEPMIRLVYERGEFDASQTELVAGALFWFAFSLPTNGLFLLLTRTFFSLQRPWLPTAIAAANLVMTAVASWSSTSHTGSTASSPRRRSQPRRASRPNA